MDTTHGPNVTTFLVTVTTYSLVYIYDCHNVYCHCTC